MINLDRPFPVSSDLYAKVVRERDNALSREGKLRRKNKKLQAELSRIKAITEDDIVEVIKGYGQRVFERPIPYTKPVIYVTDRMEFELNEESIRDLAKAILKRGGK